ncbi:MAG: hypothetical protein E7423_03400 [Ruminococcaceae bacterium]|nr:hypothetical protein [Oscillospiraceae bacterium]
MRQIKAEVNGQFVRLSSKYGGVQGEGNVTSLRLIFDETWADYGKRIVWRDSRGLDPVAVLLTADERTGESLLDYTVTIPPEPLSRVGWCSFTVEGYTEQDGQSVVALSVSERLEVRPGACDSAAEPTQSQALQLQREIDQILDRVDESARSASDSADSARDSAETAAACAIQALTGSQLSRSWAVGGTGLRADEDTNNAKYYAQLAQQSGGGGGGAVPDAHIANRSNPHQVTKAQVGLGSVDNTSDEDKPLSAAARAAISGKAPLTHTHGAQQVTAGTLAGAVQANASAQETLSSAMVRNIYAGTARMTAGETSLPTGTIYLVYEE